METNEVALVISSIAAAIGAIVYSLKHVKKSECCGSSCVQEVAGTSTPRRRDSITIQTQV